MKKDKVYSLCEALVDIVQIATEEDFRVPDSRYQISLYIEWAKEFERMHKHIEWGVDSPCEYMEAIDYFAQFKMNCYRDYHPPHTVATYS